jgi:acyl-homoserine lactone acylase PvdQ
MALGLLGAAPANAAPAKAAPPTAAVTAPVAKAPTVEAPGNTPENLDYCLAQCHSILPPGQNGNATFAEILAYRVFKTQPKHANDQYDKYERLVWDYKSLNRDGLQKYYTQHSLGLPAGGVESTVSPRQDVTIYREKATGVPHVRGTTRSGTMFGAGYASAGDRLFLMDVLRHVGRSDLTPFAGGNPGNRVFEQQQFAVAPYTEADLQRQYEDGPRLYGEAGKRLQEDVDAYVDGVNKYIADIKAGKNSLPGEYTALGRNSVDPWKPTDIVATASLIGGIFGNGGGGEVRSALALLEAQAKYGKELGTKVWSTFRAADDPEAPTTVHNGDEFPYNQSPANAPGKVLPERGSVVTVPQVTEPTGSGAAAAKAPVTAFTKPKMGMSNALVVPARNSESGNPIAVFGSQSGYFAPQLYMELDLQGPGISARGAAFAGVSFYVLLGRGQDYAWSATSAGQDITDTFAPELCEPDGKAPTLESMHYKFRGQCLPIEVLKKRNEWKPTLADGTAAGGYTLVAQRTKLGLIRQRGMVDGKPVAFTKLRSTYMQEAASGIGFSMFNDPAKIKSARDFQRAASKIGYTFNWFYTDAKDTAYFNSGANPVRAAGADPNFPNKAEAAYEWKGWNPDTNQADYIPFEQHPQGINQDYFTSWNGKQAPGTWASDDQYGYGAVYRSMPLDDRIKAGIAGGKKMTKVELVQAMEDAGTVDLRGDTVLPLALEVIGDAPTGDAAVDDAIKKLRDWRATGNHRITRKDPYPSKNWVYDEAAAVQLMDAWWPRWAKAEFASDLGPELFAKLADILPVDDPPGPIGSAFQNGWYGYASKDLRAVLGKPVKGGFPKTFCGGGDKAACRQMLIDTLKQATQVPATEVYPATPECKAGDQYCHDQIVHRALGGIGHEKIQWVNRPTYEQAVEFPAKRGQNIANHALGRLTAASSTQHGYPASNAVDGDQTTRWASNWSSPEWLTIELGGRKNVARVVLDWETAYAKDFTIQLSDDGKQWRDAAKVTGSTGGRNVVTFEQTSAKYLRVFGDQRGTKWGYSLYEVAVYPR